MLNCILRLFLVNGAVSQIDKSPLWYTNGEIKYKILMEDILWD